VSFCLSVDGRLRLSSVEAGFGRASGSAGTAVDRPGATTVTGTSPAFDAVMLARTWDDTHVGNAGTRAAASLMPPTILAAMHTYTLIFISDFIHSGRHGQHGNRDADMAACRSRACSREWKQSAEPAGASPPNCQSDACRVEFLTAGETPNETNTQSSGETSYYPQSPNHDSGGEQEPGRRGRSWSAVGLLPRATIGITLKQQPLVACRAVGRSPAKQGSL
jgi:hypothetical protein